MKHFVLVPVLFFAVIVTWAGCSKNSASAPDDMEAPAVTIVKPQVDESFDSANVDVEINATDNVGVVKVDLFLDGIAAPVATLSAAPWKAGISIAALRDTLHTLTVKASDAAGNITAASVPFWKGPRQTDDSYRMPLVEIATSANCTNCGPANVLFTSRTAALGIQGRIAIIRYHTWWPRNTDQLWRDSQTWSRPRVMYLFDQDLNKLASPLAWVDGTNMSNNPLDWASRTNSDLSVPAEAKITLTQQTVGSDIVLTIKAKGLASGKYNDLRLHTVVTESDINYNDGNDEFVHFEVMRQMYPDADGEAISLADGVEQTYTRTITPATNWVKANLKAVVFIQSNTSKTILQSARISLK